MMILASTGIRSGECRAVAWEKVLWEDKALLIDAAVKQKQGIGRTKMRTSRVVLLPPRTVETLFNAKLRTNIPEDALRALTGHVTASMSDHYDHHDTKALVKRLAGARTAIEEACIARFGTLRPAGATPVVRSDNGLIFQSRRFRAACRDYLLTQEFITPYTPEQNGIIERFFRSLKEEGVWQHSFHSFTEAKAAIRQWIDRYNFGRPHQSLGYRSPREHRVQQQVSVA
jgi:hypothetical protein